ncbi:MAG: hypothetical protein ACPKPY_07965, partial [Nitrososphaeraceae archaeon]
MLEFSKKMMYEEAILRKFVCEFQKELLDNDLCILDKSEDRTKEVLWNFIQSERFQSVVSEEKGGEYEVSEEVFSEIYTKVNTYLMEHEEE